LLNKYDPGRGYDGFGSFIGGIPRAIGQAAKGLAQNPVVMAALTAGLSTPAMAGGTALMTPAQAAVTTGALSGAASSENPFEGALRGGAIGGATGYAGEYTGGMFDDPFIGAIAGGAARGATGAALRGGDFSDIAGAVLQGGVSGGAGYNPAMTDVEAINYLNALAEDQGIQDSEMAPAAPSFFPSTPGPAWVAGVPVATMTPEELVKYGVISPEEAVQLGIVTSPEQYQTIPATGRLPGLASPESLAAFSAATPDAVPGTTLPIAGTEQSITDLSTIESAIESGNLLAPGVTMSDLAATPTVTEEEKEEEVAPAPTEEVPAEGEPIADAERPLIEKEDLKKLMQYSRDAKKLLDMYNQITGGRSQVAPFAPPARGSEMTDEQYAQSVGDAAVEYLGLDPEVMRKEGLVPGTPEYLAYILERADMLIEAAFGEDPSELLEGESVEGLQAAFRDMTEREAEQLARALYVRGALGTMTYSGKSIDPFTGEEQELGLREGESAAGDIAASQRGYARSLERLARLPGAESRRDIRGMLGRNIDIFGLTGAVAEREAAEQAAAGQYDSEEGYGGSPADFSASFWDNYSQLPPEDQEVLIQLLLSGRI
jgi:hypothetical protein